MERLIPEIEVVEKVMGVHTANF